MAILISDKVLNKEGHHLITAMMQEDRTILYALYTKKERYKLHEAKLIELKGKIRPIYNHSWSLQDISPNNSDNQTQNQQE